MKQLGFYFNAQNCTGCRTCVIACKDAHNLPVGRNFRTVFEYAGGGWRQDRMTGAWHQDVFAYYVSLSCQQCEDPACVKVCPTKAHFKRSEDGLVVIDESKCIGCGMCARACPYGAPKLDQERGKMTKCNACLERLEAGVGPICVEACPQRALEFGDIEELRRRHGLLAEIAPMPAASQTKPSITIKPPKHGKPAGDKTGTVYTHG